MILKLYLIALPLLVALDIFWIGFAAKNLYRSQIGFLMRADINWGAAISFYLLFIFGLVIFVINPSIEKNSWIHALMFGALFGLITYATYDLTNLATLKNWPILITVIDLAWGTFLASLISVITHLIGSKLA